MTSQAGAGVSNAAGIQPFRGPGGLLTVTGSLSSEAGNLLDPFDKDTFQVELQLVLFFITLNKDFKNPTKCAAHASLMANLAKTAAQAQPTPFHKLLRALSCSGILGRVYTQNIDDLELKSGMTTMGGEPSCVQLHGSAMKVQCTMCSFTEHVYHHFPTLHSGKLPACPRCEAWIEQRKLEGKRIASQGGLLRPAIILYGETHPTGDHIAAMQSLDKTKADNLLVVGTSLKTFGSVGLIKEISTGIRKRGQGKIYYMDLGKPTHQVDVFKFDHIMKADCQEFANHMLNKLGMPEYMHSVEYLEGKERLAYLVEAGRMREDMRPLWAWV